MENEEIKYWIIKNPDIGLYYRGKGENRWGKYYNQATIYRVKATAEHSLKQISWRGEKGIVVEIKITEINNV